jgi:hypothetical protein
MASFLIVSRTVPWISGGPAASLLAVRPIRCLRWLERRKAPDNQWMVHLRHRCHGAKRPWQLRFNGFLLNHLFGHYLPSWLDKALSGHLRNCFIINQLSHRMPVLRVLLSFLAISQSAGCHKVLMLP